MGFELDLVQVLTAPLLNSGYLEKVILSLGFFIRIDDIIYFYQFRV